ncbi:hypothetical protein Hanom_Chr03g00247531 [Helianthus anomalus]
MFDIRAWDMRRMESLCRACKHAVRTSKRFMGVTIGAIPDLFIDMNKPIAIHKIVSVVLSLSLCCI